MDFTKFTYYLKHLIFPPQLLYSKQGKNRYLERLHFPDAIKYFICKKMNLIWPSYSGSKNMPEKKIKGAKISDGAGR